MTVAKLVDSIINGEYHNQEKLYTDPDIFPHLFDIRKPIKLIDLSYSCINVAERKEKYVWSKLDRNPKLYHTYSNRIWEHYHKIYQRVANHFIFKCEGKLFKSHIIMWKPNKS